MAGCSDLPANQRAGVSLSGCNCEWLGLCYCEGPPVPVMTPAKACKVRLKTNKAVTLSPKSVTASEPTQYLGEDSDD